MGDGATTKAAKVRRAAEALRRIGVAARGVLYALLGVVTILAAGNLERARGPKGTLVALIAYPAGRAVVFVLALGFVAFAIAHLFALVHRQGCAWQDWLGRITALFLLGTYASLAAFAVNLALYRDGGNPHATRDWIEWLFSWPGGRVALLLIALGIAGFGGFEIWRGGLGSSHAELPSARLPLRALWRFGIAARGILFVLIAIMLARVAYRNDPREAGGTGEVLRTLLAHPAARPIMLVLAAGLLAFGLVELLIARRGNLPAAPAPWDPAAAPS